LWHVSQWRGRSKTYRQAPQALHLIHSIGCNAGGAKQVGVLSVLSPNPGTKTPRHQLVAITQLSVIQSLIRRRASSRVSKGNGLEVGNPSE